MSVIQFIPIKPNVITAVSPFVGRIAALEGTTLK